MTDQPDSEPDLEALYHGADFAPDGAQLAMIEGLTAVHWAWYTSWVGRGFSPEQAFRLTRDMITDSRHA